MVSAWACGSRVELKGMGRSGGSLVPAGSRSAGSRTAARGERVKRVGKWHGRRVDRQETRTGKQENRRRKHDGDTGDDAGVPSTWRGVADDSDEHGRGREGPRGRQRGGAGEESQCGRALDHGRGNGTERHERVSPGGGRCASAGAVAAREVCGGSRVAPLLLLAALLSPGGLAGGLGGGGLLLVGLALLLRRACGGVGSRVGLSAYVGEDI